MNRRNRRGRELNAYDRGRSHDSPHLVELGYSEGDFEFYEEIGYIGYRTGIDRAGNWTYFVAGD